MTFQLLEAMGCDKLRLCNVYSAPGRMNLAALPLPTLRGFIYMGDFNARRPDLSDSSHTPNRNGPRLLDYVRRYRLTRWNTGGATHSRGGTLDHIFTSGLVASRVKCFSVPVLFSDHVALGLRYYVLATPTSSHARTCIRICPKYFPTYISYMTTLLPTFNSHSPDELYSSLVQSTHKFYSQYVTRPHLAQGHLMTVCFRLREKRWSMSLLSKNIRLLHIFTCIRRLVTS
uniref:Endonuclease/exonuclease/phosphatase domain-containing protein n=1 Tax=Scylla olivacea TaxID=85551 RepID=A0A0P4W4C6_SCYOL